MTHTYHITGMTCSNCVAKVKSELLKLPDVMGAEVQLSDPQATITMEQHISTSILQEAISHAGSYTITEADTGMHHTETTEKQSWLATYKPVLLIFGYVTLLALIAATGTGSFNLIRGMEVFMGGFFLAFSFFKMLDLKGFAASYAGYDVIGKRFWQWGIVYAFIELLLGISFAAGFSPLLTNTVTFIVMSVSIIGVLQSVLNKRKIQCACLGTGFNLPMSTVTIIEDAAMIVMSGLMLAMMI